MPPIIMRNCLPFNIDVKVPGSKQEFFILKGEESYFLSCDLIEIFEIQMRLDGFDWTTIKIDPKTVGNEIKVRTRDIDNVELILFIKIERERAGLELLLYSKVCIINYTGLNFELSTSSRNIRRRVAGQKLNSKQVLMTNKASKLILNYKGASSGKLHTKQIGYKEDFRLKIREDPTTNVNSIYDFVFYTSLNLVSSEALTSDLF